MKNEYTIFFTFLSFFLSSLIFQQMSLAQNKIQLCKLTKKKQISYTFGQENTYINLKKFLTTPQKNLLRIGEADNLNILKSKKDDIGCEHAFLQQYHNNILVEAAILKVHECEGQNLKINGSLASYITLNTKANINKIEALMAALQVIDAERYAWEIESLERQLQQTTKNNQATFYPEGKLVILSEQIFTQLEKTHLAYKFAIYAQKPLQYKTVYIDAHTGDFLFEINRLHHNEVTLNGTAQHNCESEVQFTAYFDENNNTYCLKNDKTVVYDAQNTGSFINTNICSDNISFEDSTAVAVIWASEQCTNYFKDTHNHENIGVSGQVLTHWIHYEEDVSNAFWNGNWFVYGDGDGINYDAFVSLDIVVHEMTHALIDNTANLIYAYEAGALNEGFSDIFAILVGHFAQPDCTNWIIGEDVVKQTGKNGLRNLADPKDATMINRQPHTYKGEFWHYEATDNGGVHINSGVLSYWFYLLVEGGSGTNDLQHGYLVNSIGWEAAADIIYRTLTLYLTPTSQYIDARNATIEATIDLFGENSAELAEVLNAWEAVGLAADLNSDKSLTLTALNETTLVNANSSIDITWQSTGFINEISIDISTDNGNIWYNITQNTPNDGLFTWQVPNIATDFARIRITDNDDLNVFDLNDIAFQIESCPVISSFSIDNNGVCRGETINFFNTSSSSAHAFRWFINNLEMDNNQDFSHTFEESGIYEVKLKAIDTIRNCIKNYIEIIEIRPNIAAEFTYTIDGLQIDAFITSDTLNALSVEWQLADSFFENVPTFTHIVDNAGTYSLCLNIESNCNASTFCEDITVLTPAICEGDETWQYYISGKQINHIEESDEDFWFATDGGLSVFHKIDSTVNTYTSFNSGLTDNTVNVIAIAPNKSKWIGTQNGGLLQLKNGAWHSYTTENSNLPSQSVYDIKIDANGAKWVATNNGLLRINGGIWRVFNTTNSILPSNIINCLEIKENGDMWIGTDNGLYFYDKANDIGTTYTNSNAGLQSNHIQALAIDNEGIIWVGYEEGGLDSMNESIVTNHNDNLPNQIIQDITVDAENVKWIATESGLWQFDNINWSFFDSENINLESSCINAVIVGNNGIKWIGTENGVYREVGENWEYVDATTAVLPNNEITAIAMDNQQNIWTTTPTGLIKYKDKSWSNYIQTSDTYFSNYYFTSIDVDDNNVKWIGSLNKGLFSFHNGVWTNFSTENSDLTSNHIFQTKTVNNDIWITQSDKLVHFDGTNFSNFNFMSNVEPTALSIDNINKRAWIGTKSSGLILCEYENNSSCYTINDILFVDNQINSLLYYDSKLLVATQNEVLTYENETWNSFENGDVLFNNDTINILTNDGQGHLVAISNKNIYLRKNGSWKTYDIPQSLSSPKNIAAVVDADLKVWLATTQGIATQYRSDEAYAFFEASDTETCENYTISFINHSVGANNYKWLMNGVLMSEDADFIHEFTKAGSYNIHLIATNESGCEDVFSQHIIIHSNADNIYLPEQIAICIEDDNPIIEANTSDMYSYEWRRNGELMSTQYFCEATQQGNYELTITDNCGNLNVLQTHIYIDNDCVWPGDLNRDKVVDKYDLLMYGLAVGQYGPQRPNATTNWQGQPAFDWGIIVADNSDLKHIDANGNGVIDLSDIQLIDFHYGKSHHEQNSNIPPDLSSDVSFQPILITPPTIENNKTMEIELLVNHALNIPIHAYGIAFDIEYALPNGLNMENIELDFSNSWLNTIGNDMQIIYKYFPELNKIEVAITKTDHQNAISSGMIGKLRAEVDVVPSGNSASMLLNISNILFINNEGWSIPIATSQNSLNILPENETGKTTITTNNANKITIYPNPANHNIILLASFDVAKDVQNLSTKLYDMQGKCFTPNAIIQNENQLSIDIADIPQGIYQLVVFDQKERLHTAKLMIYH